ncbi:MAG: glycosyltransferase family 2 protein, partial [Flavobacteriales bacterium]
MPIESSVSRPKVSILSSSYNHVQFLDAFIESVYAQTYTNFELLMLDDGSKDGSGDLLMELSQKYDFKAFKRENKGFPNALNTLRRQATGDYIVIIASDDLMTPDRLENQVNALENHPKAALVCGDMQEIDENDSLGNLISNPLSSVHQFEQIICSKTYVLAPTVMIRKSSLDQVGAYDENLKVEDFDMWLRLAQHFDFLYLNQCFAYYRIHSG